MLMPPLQRREGELRSYHLWLCMYCWKELFIIVEEKRERDKSTVVASLGITLDK